MALRVFSVFKTLTVFIYDFFISNLLTISAHLNMLPHMSLGKGSFLDVGCGTGAPLQKIISKIKQHYSSIIGVDLHEGYTSQAQKLFKSQDSVRIYHMDFYEINKVLPNQKFDFILFSFSFMLMPDPIQTLRLATSCLKPNGRVAFIMTLNQKEKPWLNKLKPLIYKITTVDFGKVMYSKQFEEILKIVSLKIEKNVRIKGKYNPLLKIFPVHYVQATLSA